MTIETEEIMKFKVGDIVIGDFIRQCSVLKIVSYDKSKPLEYKLHSLSCQTKVNILGSVLHDHFRLVNETEILLYA